MTLIIEEEYIFISAKFKIQAKKETWFTMVFFLTHSSIP